MKTKQLKLKNIAIAILGLAASFSGITSCKKDALSITQTITGQKITLKLPSAQNGWIESYGEAENVESELNKLGFSLENIQEMNITVQGIEITNSKDNLTFDDVDSVVFKAVQPAALGTLKDANVNRKKSTKLENLNVKMNNGDPIKLGDVKLGIGMLLNKPTTDVTEVTIYLDVTCKLSKLHKGNTVPDARLRPTSELSTFLPPVGGCALMLHILDSANLYKSNIGTRSNPGYYDRIYIQVPELNSFSGAKAKFYRPYTVIGPSTSFIAWALVTEFNLPTYTPSTSNVFSFTPPNSSFTGPIRMDITFNDCIYFTKVFP